MHVKDYCFRPQAHNWRTIGAQWAAFEMGLRGSGLRGSGLRIRVEVQESGALENVARNWVIGLLC